MNHLAIHIFVLFFISPVFSKAQTYKDSVKHPISLNLQFAGNVGAASIGIGTSVWHQKAYLGIIYGYLPKHLNGAEVHTIVLKSYYRFCSKEIFNRLYSSLYIGTNVNYGITQNTYLNYPDYYPDGYYYTNAIHFAPFIGQKIEIYLKNQLLGISSLGPYLEIGTLDKYIGNIFTSKQVGVFDIINLCLGMSFKLAL